MEIITDIIQTTANSFDFGYCIIVNVLTYLIIRSLKDAKVSFASTWKKRLVLIWVIFSTSVIYYFIGSDPKVLLNSAILAPVSWSWIFKPICAKFNIDYKDI